MQPLPTRLASAAGHIERLPKATALRQLSMGRLLDSDGFAITAKRLDALAHAPLTAEAAATALTARSSSWPRLGSRTA